MQLRDLSLELKLLSISIMRCTESVPFAKAPYLFALLASYLLNGVTLAQYQPPPGQVRTSWVGNSLPGNGGENGFGYWVQNAADEIEVAPDGTIVTASIWDEAGRCTGLYKDGSVNRTLLKHEQATREGWGWNTESRAVAVRDQSIFLATAPGLLVQFGWQPGDIDSATFIRDQEISKEAIGLTASKTKLAVAYQDRIDIHLAKDLKKLSSLEIKDVEDVAYSQSGFLYVLAANRILTIRSESSVDITPPGLGNPVAIAFTHADDRLVVCDDGPDQQVKFYRLKDGRFVSDGAFGAKGGIRADLHGLQAPDKFCGLRGANVDQAGNLHVACGFSGNPSGTLVLRTFDRGGKLLHELANHAFVDTFGFDPDSDGTKIYSRTAIFDYDPSANRNGAWNHYATTWDHVMHPDDARKDATFTAMLRRLRGKRLLVGPISQHSGSLSFWTFPDDETHIAKYAGSLDAEGQTWAWNIDSSGHIWHGDAPEQTIRRYKFKGWSKNQTPEFDKKDVDVWKWPEGFREISRVQYVEDKDTLVISGYLATDSEDAWGLAGKTLRCYSGWLANKRQLQWSIPMPVNKDADGPGKDLSPKSISVAGDFVFVGMVKPDNGLQHVHIFAIADGRYIGSLTPGDEVGKQAGWLDMPMAIQAMQRKNGSYLVLVEDDFRGKNLVYHWDP